MWSRITGKTLVPTHLLKEQIICIPPELASYLDLWRNCPELHFAETLHVNNNVCQNLCLFLSTLKPCLSVIGSKDLLACMSWAWCRMNFLTDRLLPESYQLVPLCHFTEHVKRTWIVSEISDTVSFIREPGMSTF